MMKNPTLIKAGKTISFPYHSTIIKSAMLFISICLYSISWGQTLIAGWDFQTATNGGTVVLAAPNSPSSYTANFGTGTLSLNGNNGSSTWITATIGNQVSSFSGSNLNLGSGFSSVTSGAASLALINSSANGQSVVFSFSMSGKMDLVLSYAAQRTTFGFTTHQWDYSTNGINWTPAEAFAAPPIPFSVLTSAPITGLNNAANAFLRLTVTGATSATGNNRLDNIQLNASILPSPVVPNALFSGQVGVPLSHFITATNSPTLFGATGMPSWMSLDTLTGELTGIPPDTTSYNFVVAASNSAGTGTGILHITVNQGQQLIDFSDGYSLTYGSSLVLGASSSSGLPVYYSNSSSNIVILAGDSLLPIGVGTAIITAFQPGNASYLPATAVTRYIEISPKMLSVIGASVLNKTYDGTADATIIGSTLVGIVGNDDVSIDSSGQFASPNAGSNISVTSTQTLIGNHASFYTLSAPVNLSADIFKATQSITFPPLTLMYLSSPTLALPYAASSGLPIYYSSSNPDAAYVLGNMLTPAGVGTTFITAQQAGDNNYLPAMDVTQPLVVADAPTLTEIIMPQYIQGLNGTNINRIPFASFLKLDYLMPGATYRYYTTVVLGSEALTSNGAGVPIFASPAGFTKTTTPNMLTPGGYGTFTTDATGSYSGWFVLEPTGNATRFIPGNDLFLRVHLNDGADGSLVATRLTTTNSAKVLELVASTGANNGTGLRGLSSATDKNFVVLYDNENGTGRPLSASFVESDGMTATLSYSPFYINSVDSISGAYGVVVPNSNANGVRRIEQRSITNGLLVGCPATDADGIWPSGANTVNPNAGATAIFITNTDADLSNSCSSILNLTCFIEGYYSNGSMLPVLLNQGEATTATACDSITVELRNENMPNSVAASIKTVLHQDGTAQCVFPSLSGVYYIMINHRNAIQTWSAMPVSMNASPVSYNFSDAASKAYASNQTEVAPGVWAFYSGNLEPDENLDLLDLAVLETDIINFESGFKHTDINGDGNVDLLDIAFLETNISNFIFSNHP